MSLKDLVKTGKEMPVNTTAEGTLTEEEAQVPRVGSLLAGMIAVETAGKGHAVSVYRTENKVTLHKYVPKQ